MYEQQLVRRGRKKTRIIKTGIAFPYNILMELDEVIRRLGIPNRSKAVVEATMRYIADNTWVYEDGIVVGALSIIYDDSKKNIQAKLLEIKNMYSHNINATINLSIDDDKLIDVWIVKGPVKIIKRLIESIERINGVYTLRSMIIHKSPGNRE